MTIIQASNLRKTYTLGKTKVPVLRGVDLSVSEGEFLAVLGASGSGKSTLLHLLGALDRPDKSPDTSIRYMGNELVGQRAGVLDTYRTRDVGFVFQFYHLLPELTVTENVILPAMVQHGRVAFLGKRREILDRAGELLKRVGLGHRIGHRPAELSGGERQRVAIARALINQPKLLLADEPTGNLDRVTGASILDLLTGLHQSGQSIVVVTHDDATAARAQRTVRIEDGLVVAASRVAVK
ncbi:MAG: ABC transporter ATP-binding protein [Tepidisphaera sp.]